MARYALVVGISHYESEYFETLSKAIIDANAVANLLKQDKRYKNVEVLTGEVTGAKLVGALKTFLQKQAVKNEGLIYFTGHGFTVVDIAGETEGYLATSDCSVTIEDGQAAGQKGGLPLNTLNKLIHTSELSNLVVLLDACHSGAFLERDVEQSFKTFGSHTDYYLITGCRSFEEGIAKKREQHSVFTGALVGGLSQDNADEYGKVTGDRLFDFIYTELHSSKQEPIRMGIGRSIVLVEYPSKNKPVTAILDENGEVICPYQGLQAFDREQKEFFFGRKRLVEAIKQKLDKTPFVPVIGASGSGKSSVVRAGLIPWLEEEGNWQVLEPIKPGFEPLVELRGAFKSFFKGKDEKQLKAFIEDKDTHPKGLTNIIERLPNSERFLLVVDQFEEVFTVCANEEERQRFIELIAQVTEISACRLTVVTTMRADFLEPCLRYLTLRQQIQDQAVLMPPLSGVDLKNAITEPARRQGYTLEEELVFKILEDVGKEPGFLPLLEFALTKLWQKRDREKHLLTLQEYRKMGELTGALDLHAEQVYSYHDFESDSANDKRDEKEQEWIKRIFLRLVRTGEQEKDTRQRQPKANLLLIAGDGPEEREALSELIDGEGGLVQGRLLVAGKDKDEAEWIDLAHEALIDGWQQFAQWRTERRDLRRLRDRLSDALREWLKEPDDENLMMGGLLAEVGERWSDLILYLQSPEQDEEFYRRSDAHEKNRIAQLKLEKAGVSSLRQFESGREIEGLLAAIRNGEELKKLVGDSLVIPYPTFSPIFALQQMLYRTDDYNQFRECNRLEHFHIVYCISFSLGEELIATGSGENIGRLWNYSGELVQELRGHEKPIRSVSFSPHEHLVATASEDGTAKLWNYSGELVQEFTGHQAEVNTVSFSKSECLIITASQDGLARVWSYSGELLQELPGHRGGVIDAVFSPDGQLVATASEDGTIRLWSRTWQVLREFRGHVDSPYCVTFSPDGEFLAAGWEIRAILWKRSRGSIQKFPHPPQGVTRTRFSRDGELVATALKDGTVQLWNRAGELVRILPGHGWVMNISFSKEEQLIAIVSQNGAVKLWKYSGDLVQEFYASGSPIWGADISPDGKLIATASNDGKVRLWNQSGALVQELFIVEDSNSLCSVQFSPNGQEIAALSWFGRVQYWQLPGQLVRTFSAHKVRCVDISFSPDGKLIATASEDGIAKLWNQSGELEQELRGHQGWVNRVNFSPVGGLIATASSDGIVRLWSYAGELIQEFHTNQKWPNSISFSKDGKTIATASENNSASLWNIYNLNELLDLGYGWLQDYLKKHPDI